MQATKTRSTQAALPLAWYHRADHLPVTGQPPKTDPDWVGTLPGTSEADEIAVWSRRYDTGDVVKQQLLYVTREGDRCRGHYDYVSRREKCTRMTYAALQNDIATHIQKILLRRHLKNNRCRRWAERVANKVRAASNRQLRDELGAVCADTYAFRHPWMSSIITSYARTSGGGTRAVGTVGRVPRYKRYADTCDRCDRQQDLECICGE